MWEANWTGASAPGVVILESSPGVAELRAGGARHELDRRRFRLWSQHAVEDASGVSAVFGAVGSIDFGVNVMPGVDEGDLVLNTADAYPTLVPLLGPTEPMSIAPS